MAKAKVKQKPLPTVLYAYRNIDGDDSWIEAYDNLDSLAPELGEKRLIGVYDLVEQKRISISVTEE